MPNIADDPGGRFLEYYGRYLLTKQQKEPQMIWLNAVACRTELQKMGEPVTAKEAQFCENVFKGFVTKKQAEQIYRDLCDDSKSYPAKSDRFALDPRPGHNSKKQKRLSKNLAGDRCASQLRMDVRDLHIRARATSGTIYELSPGELRRSASHALNATSAACTCVLEKALKTDGASVLEPE